MSTDPALEDNRKQDAAVEAATGPKASPAPSPGRSRPAGRAPGVLIGVLALIVALIALAGGYLVWERQGESRRALEAKIGEFPPALARLESRIGRIGDEIDTLAPKLDAFDERLNALGDQLNKTAAPVPAPADIEHLLLIANDSLILQRDVTTALVALQTADDRLRALGDPVFAETRRRLAREIGDLQSTPRPDITGAAFAISGLQQQIEALTLESLRSPAGDRPAPSPASTNGEVAGEDGVEADWQTVFDDLWTKLRSLIVIRRSDESGSPLIGPDQRIFLNQNLRLNLESARIALLTRDAENFRHHIDLVHDWLSRYYDDRDQKIAAMLAQIESLRQVDIDPDIPDISGSLQALREALERRRPPIPADAPAQQSSARSIGPSP